MGESDPGSEAQVQRAARLSESALEYVCENLDVLRRDLDGIALDSGRSATALLDDLTSALGVGRPVAPVLDALHGVLLDAGDALGLYGRFSSEERGRPSALTVTGLSVRPPDADETVYLCPSERCSRASWPSSGSQIRCALTGQPLRADRL